MAERRMFAKSIIGSARFLRMPPTSRLLYYDLGMDADDDGCVEAFAVMRKTGAAEDDLRVLVSKGFVRVLNDDLVSLILDWKTNNYIQKDRYHPSIYAKLIDNPPLDTECIQAVSDMDTEVRLGKDSIGKDSIGEGNEESADTKVGDAPLPKKYGEFEKVTLTEEQYSKLAERFGRRMLEEYITKLDLWLAEGNRKKNHYVTIIKWITKDHPDAEKAKDDNHNSFETDDFWSAALKGSYGEEIV